MAQPESDPGKHVLGATKGKRSASLEVVGVVGEVRAAGLEQTSPTMMVYEDYARMNSLGMSLVVRTRSNPLPLATAVRAILSSTDPEMAISQAKGLWNRFSMNRQRQRRFPVGPRGWVRDHGAGAFASIGIYGVIAFAVARRTPEIGIRIAMGARGTQLVAMVIRRGMLPVFAGIAAGLLCALLVGRFLSNQLFGVSPHDPATMSMVVAVLLSVAICACWAPARRAARIDPVHALRLE